MYLILAPLSLCICYVIIKFELNNLGTRITITINNSRSRGYWKVTCVLDIDKLVNMYS